MGPHRLSIADDQPTFWDKVERGAWEPGTLRALDLLLRPEMVFVDIGAWVGALTLYATASGARVVAAEPDPRALDGLRRNVAANPDLESRVTIVPRAASADGVPVRLGARRKPGDSMSSALLAGKGETWIADAITPDELAALAGPGPRLVKIDIEGGEYRLLPALGPLLSGPDVALLLALHPDILREAGETEIEAETSRALGGLAGWTAARIGCEGPEPAELSAILRAGPGEWLFVSPGTAVPWARPQH